MGTDTILVSDAGGKMQLLAEPEHNWAQHSLRVLDLTSKREKFVANQA
jgi:hypothetical protein